MHRTQLDFLWGTSGFGKPVKAGAALIRLPSFRRNKKSTGDR
jgi:hypothetical protein